MDPFKGAPPPRVQRACKKKTEIGGAYATQPSVPAMFDAVKQWDNNDPRSKRMDTLIVEMMATDNQPFTIVEDVGFMRIMSYAEPRYKLKKEKFYRTGMLSGVSTQVSKKMKTLISLENAGPHLSFTTDCWSGDTESLMSLACHFIDADWERKQVVLNVKVMDGSHTGEYISQLFLAMLEKWEIDTERVVLVLRDGGANVVKGMRLADLPDLSCSAHASPCCHRSTQQPESRK